MKTLRSSLAMHQAFHQQSLNRIAHALAVPFMIFGALIPLSWMGVAAAGGPVTLAMIACAVMILTYLQMDVRLGAAIACVLTPMLYLAHVVSELPMIEGVLLSAFCLGAGIVIERLAHARIEGRVAPAAETVNEFFFGPMWLAMEAKAVLGVGSSALAASKSVAR